MTIKEFQAWLDGYSAAIQGPPNAQQWEMIKKKIATLYSETDLSDYFASKKSKTTYPDPKWRYVDTFTYEPDFRINEPKDPNSVYTTIKG